MKFHNYRIVNKRRFFTFSFLILLITMTIMVSSLCVNANSKEKYIFTDVYVQDGDSLWSLSKKVNNTDLEIREYIDNVISINHLNGGSIAAGQLLRFPISK